MMKAGALIDYLRRVPSDTEVKMLYWGYEIEKVNITFCDDGDVTVVLMDKEQTAEIAAQTV